MTVRKIILSCDSEKDNVVMWQWEDVTMWMISLDIITRYIMLSCDSMNDAVMWWIMLSRGDEKDRMPHDSDKNDVLRLHKR